MIHILNNNTTHNYSKYSTRPSHIYNAFLKVKYSIQKISNSKIFETNQSYLFQTKQLLCWGPDLAFLNLRNTFSNIFKALQICWSAARNNKKIVFINGNDSSQADSVLVNTWLIQQCKRRTLPRKLNNISNIAAKYINNLTVKSKSLNITNNCKQISALPNNTLFTNLNIFLSNLKSNNTYGKNRKVQGFIKNSNALVNSPFSFAYSRSKAKAPAQLIQNYKFKIGLEIQKAKKLEGARILQSLYNNNKQSGVDKGNQFEIKTLKILKIKKAIELQVKEGQTLTQQLGGEITAPLVGFFTNTKTGFNTLQNQLNEEFYNHCRSVNFENTSKSLFKTFINIGPKPEEKSVFTPNIPRDKTYKNYIWSLQAIGKLNFKEAIYNQKYLPFSFYIRPITSAYLVTRGESVVQQTMFGNIFAWRLKGQHVSSVFYSQFKVFDLRAKYKPKQLAIANQNNMEPFKKMGQLQFPSSKPQILFKNSDHFLTLKSSRINKASLDFYLSPLSLGVLQRKKQRENAISSKINKNRINPVSIFIRLKWGQQNRHSNNRSVKLSHNRCTNSINSFYVKRFYLQKQRLFAFAFAKATTKAKEKLGQNVKTVRAYNTPNAISLKSNRSSITTLFKKNTIFKAYQNQRISKRVIPKQFRQPKKQGHYSRLVNSNQLSQYQMFAKSPFINNKLADIIFFINPEKNQNLVNQANSLKIPTIGVISGLAANQLGRQNCNYYNLNNLVNYPILGNSSSSFFIYTLIGIFIKTLRSS